MIIAIIGSGNVGGALAQRFIEVGHTVVVGARFPLSEKSIHLATKIGEDRFTSPDRAAAQAEVIVLATPASKAVEVAQELGDTTGKIIIDTMNIVPGLDAVDFTNTADVILANTSTQDVVKCFNTTGIENMLDPTYHEERADMFMAGDSQRGKAIASQLAKEIGFAECYDLGGNDRFTAIEQLAFHWVNLAILQGQGRDIAFKLLKR
ncbi:NAD(P)-binding domain-containing protein [Spirosoma koreense]